MTTKNGTSKKRAPSTPKGAVVAQMHADGTSEVHGAKIPAPAAKARKAKEQREDLVVFAFRLTEAEREAIHKAAGPAKASKFVRALTRAAAQRDLDAVTQIVNAIEA